MSEKVDPNGMLLELSGKTDEEASLFGESKYRELYLQQGRSGSRRTHDDEIVIFFEDRYHHAFHSSENRARNAYAKDILARERIERMEWIGHLIEGRFPNFECWEVPLKVPEEGRRNFPGKRLYISWEHNYIVWLKLRNRGGFIFSTGYCCHPGDIAHYTKGAKKLCPSVR